LPFDAPSTGTVEQAQTASWHPVAQAAASHPASILFLGAMALAWAGTAGVVWAGFKATARFDDTDFPL